MLDIRWLHLIIHRQMAKQKFLTESLSESLKRLCIIKKGLGFEARRYSLGLQDNIQDPHRIVSISASIWEGMPPTSRVGAQGLLGFQIAQLR